MKKVLFIALLLCGIGWGAKAQTVAVKSNILYDATATVNLGAEVAFNRHWSLDISGNYNGWDVASDKSWKHWMVQPEARYWLHEKFNGHYFGVHGVYMDYDMSHVNFMSVADIDGKKRAWGKIRYNHKGAWCTVERTGEDEILCTFDEPVRAITPGQALVLYDGEYVLGGGTIL